MASSPNPSARDGAVPPSPTPGRRPRAPTITIDTSNASPHEMDHLSDNGRSIHGDSSPMLRPQSNALSTPTDLRPSASFESRESRPTSPHNFSSPSPFGNPHGFLSVPNQQRSRGGSIDSEVAESASMSDTTYVNTNSQSTEAPSKAFDGEDGRRRGAGDHPVLSDEEALKPDPGTEADFQIDNNPFAFTPALMTKLLDPKSLGAFHAVGGLPGLEKGLRTDRNAGLSVDEAHLDGFVTFEEATATSSPRSDSTAVSDPKSDLGGDKGSSDSFVDRRRIFNDNRLPERKAKSVLQLAWMAYNDKVLILLTVAAVIALALGLYQALTHGGVEWIEGVAIIVAISVVVGVGALNDWQKERQFVKLNKKKDDRNVKVVRSGTTREISVHDVLVGDVLLVEPGDILPVDGIFIVGHGVKCDESSATGESDVIKKTPADEAYRAMEGNGSLKKIDPFMVSGGKVTEGVGRILVTATGINSSYGKTMLALREDNEATPLQVKLNKLADYIAKLGGAAALVLFIALFIKFLAQLPNNNDTPAAKGQQFLQILIVAVTIVVVAVPEGLPLAVTLALAFATKRMLKDNNLVRVLRSCETMGNATSICSDKTGTLTQNVMTVVAGSLGTSSRFSNRATRNTGNKDPDAPEEVHDDVDDVTANEFIKTVANDVVALWKDSIVINSTAFEGEQNGQKVFIGSKTETALLDFGRDFLHMDSVSLERSNAEIVQMVPFDSSRKCMAMVIKQGKQYRLMVKGASEIMLRYCSQIIRDPTTSTEATTMTTSNRKDLDALIEAYASRSLRTIGFIYRDFESWPPRGAKRSEEDKTQAVFEDVCKDMVFLGLVGIQDPLRPGVPGAVEDCIRAGVFPRMVTGDNITTAKAIATECGIFTEGGIALEGPDFRKMSKLEQRQIIPKLQVLARSSPDDKRILVRRLKEMGETVAVTGDGTNDAPALKAADVGFSMNIAGTEVAKEASDIVLMDDNFASIVKALMWGRAVNDAVRKFLQFQITVNITAVLLAFVSAVSNSNEESVLTAVQLLWVNLIMDTMAALALATDPPSRKILERKPDPKSAPLFSVTMWKMIIGQAIYQLAVTYVLYFAGGSILDYRGLNEVIPGSDPPRRPNAGSFDELQTLVFNTFVWMQIFNAFNNRRLDNRFNIFEGITRNWFFGAIWLTMIGGQVLIIFVGGAAFNVTHQEGKDWAIAIVLGAISIPVGVAVRLIPNEFAVKLVPQWLKDWSSKERDMMEDEENPIPFNQALYDIKDELAWLKKYKGGRLRGLQFQLTHPREAFSRSPSRSRSRASSSLPHTPNNEAADMADGHSPSSGPPSPEPRRRRDRGRSRSNSALAGAAMAGIIAGSVVGWSPTAERGEGDSIRFARDRSKSDLSRDAPRIETHPSTDKGDSVVVERPVEQAGNAPPSQSTATTPAFGLGPFSGQPASSSSTAPPKE